MPQIEVKFDIDANGILNVSAKDLGTGKEQTVRIEQSSGLSETEIERMGKDAEAHAEEDKRKRALAEQRNQADSMCWQLEKLIKEHEAKLNQADKDAVTRRHRKDPRGSQERRRGTHQIGRARTGAGIARPKQNALRKSRRTTRRDRTAQARNPVLNPAPVHPPPAATTTPSTRSSR